MTNNELELTYSPIYAEVATYQKTGLKAYDSNPLITALPPILSSTEFIRQIAFYPEYEESERMLPSHLRLHALSTVTKFFHPMSRHVKLEQTISRQIRQGYEQRNPTHLGFWKENDRQLQEVGTRLRNHHQFRSPRNATLSSALVGFSGTGKSVGTQEILLKGYPQVIHHAEYNGKPFNHYQVCWLTVECPHDGSIGQLCNRIFLGLDEVLGTRYCEIYGSRTRSTVDSMILNIARLAQVHTIGVLVIDEIQRLNRAKANGADRMMNFFIELINTVNIPIMLVGTPDAHRLLSTKFSLARRAAGQGDSYWNPLKNNKQWRSFINKMWQYQYTREATKLTDEIADSMHDASQGIVDIAIKVFMLAQIRAIVTQTEQISPSLIESVSLDRLVRLQPMLDALRKKDLIALRNYDDMKMPDINVHIHEAISEISAQELPE